MGVHEGVVIMTGDFSLVTKLNRNRETNVVITMERRIVFIRWLGIVSGGIALPFLGLHDIKLMYGVILFAILYNTFYQFYWSLPDPPRGIATNPTALALGDILMTDAAIYATGGIHSDFFVIYFLIVVMSAMRFGGVAASMVTLLSIAAYVGVVFLRGTSSLFYASAEILLRMGFVVATGIFVGYVSDKARQSEREAHAAVTEAQQHLQESTALLYKSLEIHQVLQTAAEQALQLSQCDIVIVSPSAQAQDLLPSIFWSELKPRWVAKKARLLQDHDIETALAFLESSLSSGRKAFTVDSDNGVIDIRTVPAGPALGVPDGTTVAVATVDLLHGDQPLGKVFCVRTHPEAWSQTTHDVLEVFASRIAMAMTNAFVLAQSKTQAITDPVTGVYNHRYFYEYLDRYLTDTLRNKRPLSLIVIDVDSFKMFNDTYGHLVGDMTLKAVADIIRESVQSEGMVARFGGDEFAIVLPSIDNQRAIAMGEDIRRKALDLSNVAIFEPLSALSLSIGVASSTEFTTPDKLFEQADMALGLAKKEGKNRVRSATGLRFPEMLAFDQNVSQAAGENSPIHMINALMSTLGARSSTLRQRALAVSKSAWQVAQRLNLPPWQIERVRQAALIHDVGLLGLPDNTVISWDAPAIENAVHATLGERLIASVPVLQSYAKAVRHHHEWFDGSGYPDNLAGADIPIESRIIAYCDAFAQWCTTMPPGEALDNISRRLGTQFDPDIWPAFLQVVDDVDVLAETKNRGVRWKN